MKKTKTLKEDTILKCSLCNDKILCSIATFINNNFICDECLNKKGGING